MWVTNIYPFARDMVGNNSRTLHRLAMFENNRQWQDVFNRLVALATNLYEWKNLPESCDAYFLEQTLLWTGRCCIIDDPDLHVKLSLRCTPASGMNFYYENVFYRAVSVGYSKPFRAITHYNKGLDLTPLGADFTLSETKGVVIFDNTQGYPLIETLMMYTDKIVDAMRTLDVLLKQLKIPAIITTDESTKTSVQAAIDNIDRNLIAIMVKPSLKNALNEAKSLPTGVQGTNLELVWKHLHNLWSEALTAIGINNMNSQDKKERLIVDEVNSNNDFVKQNSNYRLDSRKHGCENYKAAFGEEIDVVVRHEDEVIQNGNIYDDAKRSNELGRNKSVPET